MPLRSTLALLTLALLSSLAPAAQRRGASQETPWDARAAEHLLSRAGFGARPAEIARALERGLEATVEELLRGGRAVEPFFVERPDLAEVRSTAGMGPDERRQAQNERRRDDRRQMQAYEAWWIERMLAGDDPLRDRMSLFWHGFFTSSYVDVRRSHEMIAQHGLLRDNALESYAVMLRGIVRDPAMLRYLDNDQNRRQEPNENLARELLELFSLGEGHYSEQDIREIARALTGYAVAPDGEFRFVPRLHDRGPKEILGVRGRHDADAVVEILLRQPACARHVAGRILTYLEGMPPEPARLEEYAAVLRSHDYALAPLLEKLFLDPRFYRDEIVGARVAGPIDFLVGMARRLDVRPPVRLISQAAANLGQNLFQPPNVKGWEEGPAWITTASMLQRGNVAGLLLGTVDLQERDWGGAAPAGPQARRVPGGRALDPAGTEAELDEEPEGEMGGAMEPGMRPRPPGAPAPQPGAQNPQQRLARELMRALGEAWTPPLNLTWRLRQAGLEDDAQIARRLAADLLAIPVPAETLARLERYLVGERAARGIAAGSLLAHPRSEEILRRLAHLILSSPEAQLH